MRKSWREWRRLERANEQSKRSTAGKLADFFLVPPRTFTVILRGLMALSASDLKGRICEKLSYFTTVLTSREVFFKPGDLKASFGLLKLTVIST